MSEAISQIEPLAVSAATACQILACSRTTLCDKIARGEIAARKNGKKLLIEISELKRFVAALPPAKLKYFDRRCTGRPIPAAKPQSTKGMKARKREAEAV